jgi:hypothetical protein
VHHDEQHRLGADAFGDKYHIDLWALAAEFGRRSPDWQMRASLKLVDAFAIRAAVALNTEQEVSHDAAVPPR